MDCAYEAGGGVRAAAEGQQQRRQHAELFTVQTITRLSQKSRDPRQQVLRRHAVLPDLRRGKVARDTGRS